MCVLYIHVVIVIDSPFRLYRLTFNILHDRANANTSIDDPHKRNKEISALHKSVERPRIPSAFCVKRICSKVLRIRPSSIPGFVHRKIYPMSSSLRQAIAILQLLFSKYNLYSTNRKSIREEGLSSPYIIIFPYFIISLVNLICSALVSSYTHVTALAMKTRFCRSATYKASLSDGTAMPLKRDSRNTTLLSVRPVIPPGKQQMNLSSL